MNEVNWERLYKNIKTYLDKYVDVEKVKGDVVELVIMRFEELTEEGKVPEVLIQLYEEFSDEDGLTYDDIKAIVLEYVLKA